MSDKKIDPRVSKYFSNLAKKRKDGRYGFNDREVARAAGEKGKASQRAKKKARETNNQ